MISNEWWDRGLGKRMTCTADPNVKNVGYAGATVIGGDSAVKMLLPAFADELKFQWGGGSRVVTFSLKARASITMGGRTADAVTWFDPSVGAWTTSTAFPAAPFVEDRKSTRLNSSHGYISYAVFCLKKKKTHSKSHKRTAQLRSHYSRV